MTKIIELDDNTKLPDRVLLAYVYTAPEDAIEQYRVKWGRIAKVCYAVKYPGRVDCFIPMEDE